MEDYMSNTAANQRPSFKGLSWHREQYYSFFIPLDWHKSEWADDRNGVIYSPDPDDPQTVFAVEVTDAGFKIEPDDIDALAEGFFESVEALPDVEIEARKQRVVGALLTLEAKYTFRDQDAIRKRWVRLLYHQTRQVAMTAQGSTPEQYDYWLPMFYEAMMTAKVHNSRPDPDSLGDFPAL
jgi:hypothetical protein